VGCTHHLTHPTTHDSEDTIVLEGLPVSIFTGVSPVALLLAVVWMIFTGKLVTRREADGLKEERDYWRSAFFEEQSHTEALMETGRVTRDVLRALPVPKQGEADET
jgi:hypothetical protein